jgi:hypothetical protein
VVTSAARHEAVEMLVESHSMRERRACSVIGAGRTSIRIRSRGPEVAKLRERVWVLAWINRRFGCWWMHVLFIRGGHVVNHKKTQRLYWEEGLTDIRDLRAITEMEMREARDLDEIGDIVLKKVSMIEANQIKERLQAIGERSS